MIDLRSIARHLRLPVEQIRLAADLIQQGYQPAFIERFRADETGNLPHSLLWSLKLSIERQQRLEESRSRSIAQLPEGIELDSEAKERLALADTEVEIDSTMRAFRARRTMQQNAEREGVAGQLLEKLMAYSGAPIEDIVAWTQTELSCEKEAAEHALQGCKRLISSLLAGDSAIAQRLRQVVQRRSNVKIVLTVDQNKPESTTATAESKAVTAELGPAVQPHVTDTVDDAVEGPQDGSDDPFADDSTEAHEAEVHDIEAHDTEAHNAEAHTAEAHDVETAEGLEDDIAAVEDLESGGEAVAGEAAAEVGAEAPSETVQASTETPVEATSTTLPIGPVTKGSIAKKGKRKKSKDTKAAAKNAAKISPRQRRRRWLISMLQPFNGMDKPLPKLSAYQQLMIGRGRRSQLVNLHLSYDTRILINIVRDAFVSDRHPLLGWFTAAIEDSMSRSMLNRLEQDAIAELEELAQQHLFEVATEPLREQLQQRPVRGHRILVIDAVGPKTSSVAIVDGSGRVLQTDEITCSAQPQVVTQNVVRLGELVHRFKVTLVALTNGPARRFLVHTLRELVNQSADSGLRWTMVDRGGAEAYAASRIALQELPEHNRRDRATIWIARRLQNPLCEMVKLDASRLRLGSYQRELPAEPLKKLVNETISDCVCSRGIDVLSASVQELMAVPGVGRAQADQIVRAIGQGKIHSREDLLASVSDWPEASSRQAIAFLRVFDSPNTLDATAIHPDDYKLAERLIQNAELVQPPAAPAGWKRPLPPPPVAATPAPAVRAPAAPFAQGLNESLTAENATETPAVEIAPEVEVAAPAAAIEVPVEAAPEPVAEGANATDGEAIASGVESATVATESQPVADAGEAATPAIAMPEQASIPPEYPEDVLAAASTASPIDVEKLARGWQVGREKLRWIASCLQDPFADGRLNRTPVPMQKTMPTLESLEPGMCLWVVVVGVADFGAFVELGPECSGLIHISRLSPNFVEDPHQCVQVGDLVQAWVVAVDSKKRRVAMTAISPAQRAAIEKSEAQRAAQRAAERAESSQRGGRPERGQGGPQGGPQGGQGRGQAQSGQGQRGGQGQGQRTGQPAGQGNQPGNFAGAGSGGGRGRSGGGQGGQGGGNGGGHGGGGRGQQRGGPRGGRDRDGGRDRSSQPIIVTSKKPKAPISKDMVEGTAPLRSFSDLLQFYEHKRTDPPTTDVPTPSKPESQEQVQQPGASE
jgi:protein Tex